MPKYRKAFWMGLAALILVTSASYQFVFRPWHMHWGATAQEVAMPLIGDAEMPRDAEVSTRALTIHAPAKTVWAWVVQLGQNRNGSWYSYEWLENLFAAEMHPTEAIDPRLQSIQVGTQFYFSAAGATNPVMVGTITKLEAGRALSLNGWSITLQPLDANTTRMVVRYPVAGDTLMLPLLSFGVFEPAHFIMETGMMLGIKRLSERDPQLLNSGGSGNVSD